jgi:hypothetical protein
MADNENQKYQCGCGKSYTSYPAFSTHKRLKHQNQAVSGTLLPKQYVPKRGRPSFSLPNQTTALNYTYSALTTIEITLLRLEETYGRVLTEPEVDNDVDLAGIYQGCEKLISCKIGETLTIAIRNFN